MWYVKVTVNKLTIKSRVRIDKVELSKVYGHNYELVYGFIDFLYPK